MANRENKRRRKEMMSELLAQREREAESRQQHYECLDKEQIKQPLWNIMLSTNDCNPGCGCEADKFQMTQERIQQSVVENGIENAKLALIQIDELIPLVEIEGFRSQTNLWMETKDQAIKWLEGWKTLLQQAIEEKSVM
jgi:hypothetical protein